VDKEGVLPFSARIAYAYGNQPDPLSGLKKNRILVTTTIVMQMWISCNQCEMLETPERYLVLIHISDDMYP